MSLAEVVLLVVSAAEKAPEPEDVKAGWTAFAMFIGLFVVLALLGLSLAKQLRRAQAAEDAGVYGRDEGPADRQRSEPTSAP